MYIKVVQLIIATSFMTILHLVKWNEHSLDTKLTENALIHPYPPHMIQHEWQITIQAHYLYNKFPRKEIWNLSYLN